MQKMPGGGVLPMWWVIHMCRGFDPLFSLWQDRARSFWGIFLIHQQQSYLLGYKNYQFLQKSIFLAPNSIFSSIFLGPIFSGQRHTPISFQAEYPPPGKKPPVIFNGNVFGLLQSFGLACGWVVPSRYLSVVHVWCGNQSPRFLCCLFSTTTKKTRSMNQPVTRRGVVGAYSAKCLHGESASRTTKRHKLDISIQ